MSRAKGTGRIKTDGAGATGGLWHQPVLMNLLADLLIVAAVAGLSWAALVALQRLPLFPLRELVVASAPRQVALDQIEHAARSAVRGNFFTVDLEAARVAFEKLPWVRKAAVRRHWPDGLVLTLEEHEAVARWHRPGGEQLLVNRQGEVFAAERPEGVAQLPLLAGPEGSAPELLRRHAEFSAALAATGRHVVAATLSPRLAWRLKLDDGVTVELGREQEQLPLAARMVRLVEHYAAVRAQRLPVRVIDMRYPNGFALAFAAAAQDPRS